MKVPFYVITASVPPGNRVINFHGTDESSASSMLANQPRFRWGSFDVAIPGLPAQGPEDSLELRWDDRKVLRLYQDGTLAFRGRADADLLGWGVEPHAFERFPKLDPLVVVEVNTSFVHLYRRIVERLKHPVEQVFFHLSLHDFAQNGLRLFLTKYFPSKRIDWATATKYFVHADAAESEVVASAAQLAEAPNAVAYLIVQAFFSMFDMPEDNIPFVTRSDRGLEVDLDAIRAL